VLVLPFVFGVVVKTVNMVARDTFQTCDVVRLHPLEKLLQLSRQTFGTCLAQVDYLQPFLKTFRVALV
jgi:hypothetical protein